MVRSIIIVLITLFSAFYADAQKIGREIKNYVNFSAYINEDTLSYHDTLEIIIEIDNITPDTITIYPEGIVYLRQCYTEYQKELFLITDRKTGKSEKRLLPNESISLNFEFVIEQDIFITDVNRFSIIFITYPYWLKKKNLTDAIFGKWESEIKRLVVL